MPAQRKKALRKGKGDVNDRICAVIVIENKEE